MRWSVVALIIVASQYAVTGSPLIKKRDISDDLLNQLSFFEQYAAAAYCSDNNEPNSAPKLLCSFGNCPSVESADTGTITEFRNEGLADATGFVAVDRSNQLVVVAYRGSRSVANWLGNVNIVQQEFLCSDCWVHGGFLSSWEATRDQVSGAVQNALAANPGFRVIVTGHSLGGAIATLAASELRDQGFPVALYTYGSPMVGNDVYAQYVTNQSGGNYRVTHQSDAVPKLPGYGILNYRHVSPQYWITSDNGDVPSSSQIQFSEGIQDLLGNWAAEGFSVLNHLWYFNFIAGCSIEQLEITKRDLPQRVEVVQ